MPRRARSHASKGSRETLLAPLFRHSGMSATVRIVDYDPQWPTLFEKEKSLIHSAIGHIVAGIEHIGSTAVPNLGTKPIIDIIVAVNRIEDAERCIIPFKKSSINMSLNMRLQCPREDSLTKGPQREQHYHLHMVEMASDFRDKHCSFETVFGIIQRLPSSTTN